MKGGWHLLRHAAQSERWMHLHPAAPGLPWSFLPASHFLLKWGWHVWADERVKAGERRDAQVGSSAPKDSLPTPTWLCSAQPFPMGGSSHQPGHRAEPPHGASTAASCATSGQEINGEILLEAQVQSHHPWSLCPACRHVLLTPAPQPLLGRRALDEQEAPGPGKGHICVVFPGRREGTHMVAAGQGFPAGTHVPVLRHCKGR